MDVGYVFYSGLSSEMSKCVMILTRAVGDLRRKRLVRVVFPFFLSLSLVASSSPILWSSSVRCSPDRTDASYW